MLFCASGLQSSNGGVLYFLPIDILEEDCTTEPIRSANWSSKVEGHRKHPTK